MLSPLPSECLLLEAGGNVFARVDLSSVYWLFVNTYLIQLDTVCTLSDGSAAIDMLRNGSDSDDEANRIPASLFHLVPLTSNIIQLQFRQPPFHLPYLTQQPSNLTMSSSSSSSPPSVKRANPFRVQVGYVQCSSSQQSVVNSILPTAKTIADKSVTYMTRSTSDRHYVRWFGRYTDTPRGPRETVKTTYTRIASKLDPPYSFNIHCSPPSCGSSSVYAYVMVYDSSFTVHLCGAFWSAPSTPAFDSKPGTIIHELSHFQVIGQTQDHTYGSGSAEDLARTSPAKAIYNADNVEYFSETCCT